MAEALLDPKADALSTLRALRFTITGFLAETPPRSAAAFSRKLAETLEDARQFRQIVRDRDFDIHFQPIVDLATGAVHHHEVLSRFASRDTAAKIRIAEELEMIQAFDLAVLDMALRTMRQPGNGLLRLAINVSAASLGGDEWAEALIRRTSINPGDRRRLMVEVTETAALEDLDGARRRLEALRSQGVRVCIDDFGAGAASYEYLRTLPVDMVKLDGRLSNSVIADAKTRTMVGHLTTLCQSLGCKTIAEQVEDQAVADALRDLEIDMGQGWLFARPSAKIVTTIADRSAGRRLGAIEEWG